MRNLNKIISIVLKIIENKPQLADTVRKYIPIVLAM